jgi:DNA-binding HxlR family transcriptional regulator
VSPGKAAVGRHTRESRKMGEKGSQSSLPRHVQIDESMYTEMEELLSHALKISDRLIRLHNQLPEQEIAAEKKATERLLSTISQKWTIEILYVLFMKEARRYNELKDELRGISSRTLSDKLKMLDQKGYVTRRVFDEYPARIEYSLSDKGRTTARLILPLVFYLLFIGDTEENHEDSD